MVFNATFNNISVISWWSLFLVEKPEYPEKTTDLSQVTDKLVVEWSRVLDVRLSEWCCSVSMV
jgi:hypothetical protein